MKKQFLTAILLLLASSHGIAQVIPFTEEEKDVYSKNYDAIVFRCTASGQDAYIELRQKFFIPTKKEKHILQLLVERDIKKAICDYVYNAPYDRIHHKQNIDSIYQDSLDYHMLPYNEEISGKTISLTLRMSKSLGLSDALNDHIANVGLCIARKLRRNPNDNYEVSVMDTLRKILPKETLTTILRSKNVDLALEKGQNSLEYVKSHGMLGQNVNVDEELNQSVEYYLQELTIKDYYVGHENVLNNNLRDLWKRQPLLVRMYESIRTKEKIEKENNMNNNIDFAW